MTPTTLLSKLTSYQSLKSVRGAQKLSKKKIEPNIGKWGSHSQVSLMRPDLKCWCLRRVESSLKKVVLASTIGRQILIIF